MAVIITARNSLHTILNFQFFSELLPQSPQNLPKKSQTSELGQRLIYLEKSK